MPPPNILLVRFSSLGDVLLTTPLIRALRARHPDATLTALTKEEWAPLLVANPHLDQVVSIARGESVATVARAIRSAGFTHRLDLHGSVRTRILRMLAPGSWTTYDARRRARRILIREKRDSYGTHVPVPERYFEAARELDVTPDGGPPELCLSASATARAEEWLSGAGLDGPEPLVAIAPGAAHATKRWPVRHWRQLAGALARAGCRILVVGGTGDRAVGAELVAAVPSRLRSAAGALDLQATGALLQRARVVISGDTGPMHLATAVGTPVVALFGPTVEAFGFFPYRANAVVLQRELPCRPCGSKGGPRCPLGHHRCLEEIGSDMVLERALEFCR